MRPKKEQVDTLADKMLLFAYAIEALRRQGLVTGPCLITEDGITDARELEAQGVNITRRDIEIIGEYFKRQGITWDITPKGYAHKGLVANPFLTH